jgi:glycogen(starch) synthase
MKILLVTDSFPPNCGGSGWSTYELARGLHVRGHAVSVLQPRPGQARHGRRVYGTFAVDEFATAAPAVPFVRNAFKNERLWRRLASHLEQRLRTDPVDIVHAQHVQTTVPAVRAGRALATPVVATVRDYWPVCYWSDLIHDPRADHLCPACTATGMTRCLRPRAGAAWPAALPLIPYMRRNLATKRQELARADAIIAVSSVIERDLRTRAAELADAPIYRIPNPVDIAAIRQAAASRPRPLDGPYALYSGKLATNKGVQWLLDVARQARLPWPLVVVGDGPLRTRLEAEAKGHDQDVRFTGWLDRDEALTWVHHASLLVFPSHGPESLSRVLLEGAALGVPIAAMDTGGTRDIITNERTGLLSTTADGLARDVDRLVRDRALAETLGRQAHGHVSAHFDADAVVARVEAVYAKLADAPRGRR